jgi:hypothetical protein
MYSNIEYFDREDQLPQNSGTAPSEFLRQDLYVAEELIAAASNHVHVIH